MREKVKAFEAARDSKPLSSHLTEEEAEAQLDRLAAQLAALESFVDRAEQGGGLGLASAALHSQQGGAGPVPGAGPGAGTADAGAQPPTGAAAA